MPDAYWDSTDILWDDPDVEWDALTVPGGAEAARPPPVIDLEVDAAHATAQRITIRDGVIALMVPDGDEPVLWTWPMEAAFSV